MMMYSTDTWKFGDMAKVEIECSKLKEEDKELVLDIVEDRFPMIYPI